MHERKSPGMQAQALAMFSACGAGTILRVADYRMARFREMHAYLVFPSSLEIDAYQGSISLHGDAFPFRA